MAFTVTIRTDNAAFDPNPVPELTVLLQQVSNKLQLGVFADNLQDASGNTVGRFLLEV